MMSQMTGVALVAEDVRLDTEQSAQEVRDQHLAVSPEVYQMQEDMVMPRWAWLSVDLQEEEVCTGESADSADISARLVQP